MTQRTNDEHLFAAARAMPSAEREHFLARACRDATTRQRLTTLLDAFDDAVDFDSHRSLEAEHGFEQLRSYRLLQELGEGGCGIAYLAEQLAPVKRQVALKVIKPGMDTKAVVARFEAERQLLALMDHPNVAKVFDAGSTASGRPFFVMELVQGIRITEYCEQMQLSIAERLQLFVQVCHAIQHAHHKGVMHRDIKPSNVLVTMHDGQPMVKVIDFGIAKAIQGPLSEQTLHTALDQFLGTPAYISPEQTELGQRNVDTRSDIYSLGVLLYELLTGCTPLDTEELLQSSADEMRRRVREEEPLIPSARLKEVRGDLDWIVMRCLEKEAGRRYQTVSDVIAELHRYLRHEPIEARPPSVPYLVTKFARRNRAAFAALLGAAIFVVAFIVTLSIQTQRIAAAKDRAEQEGKRAEVAAEFMLETFAKAEPFGYAENGQPETVKETLDRAGRWLREHRNQRPEVRARLLESIGRAYRRRAEEQEAIGFLQEALHLRRQVAGGKDDVPTVEVMTQLASGVRETGDLAGSERLLEEGAAMLRRLGQQHSLPFADVLAHRGRLELRRGRLDAANEYLDASLALVRELLGPRNGEVAQLLVTKSTVFSWKDDLAASEHAAREALDIYSTTVSKLNPDRILAQMTLGETLREAHKLDEASAVLHEALEATRRLFGDNGRRVADVLDSLAKVAWEQGRLAEAESLAQQALNIELSAEGANHSRTAFYRTSLAAMQLDRHEYAQAEVQARAALDVFEKTLQPDHPYTASAEFFLGEALLGSHRPKEAEPFFRAAAGRSRRTNELEWRVARSLNGLGEALYLQGRAREAETYLVDSYRILSADPHTDASARAVARERVARFYTEREQRDRLQALMDTTHQDASGRHHD
jgi:eukaryotic-like serine/threonine-protein kinase